MAAQTLVDQHVIFISSTGQLDTNAILANSNIQTLAANSAGGDLVITQRQYANWNASTSTWTWSWFLDIECFVAPSFQATIQAAIPGLQAAFPQYTVVTWGNSTTFGN